ncbi:hypothetical protein PCYB_002130 [Plasmodium cynomolgi strain B]|uniref:CYIR protein n=1 Tax=Plasmodium cynomolgi (strain B) TaxID=1120755 RepID=K6UZP2_PLACD|nr:hypothetical protein PCYB_002130 [Plasmodium cynomolgi strain B]GAB69464.1 hypothetical protein PCYB_002130 [Plasmodium cynomolgi strain B]
MFEDNVHSADCTPKRSLESILWKHPFFGKHKNKIVKNWCRALTMKEDSTLYNERCAFLYYWIGSKVKGAFDSFLFPTMTKVLYDYLKQYGFSGGKIIYDYSHNHKTIEEQLEKSGKFCRNKYCDYLREVEEAFKTIKRINNSSRDEYCTHLIEEYGKYFDQQGDLNLEYQDANTYKHALVMEEELEDEEHDKDDEEEEVVTQTMRDGLLIGFHSKEGLTAGTRRESVEPLASEVISPETNTTSPSKKNSVGSFAAATLGMTSIIFLLYKFTPLYSRINTFLGRSNNSKSKRRRSVEHNLYIESDDTTQYSTESSTLVSMEEFTTENSTICSSPNTTQSKGKNRKNQQTKNISYHAM